MAHPKYLYHYTSQKGLLGIMENKLWMTSIMYLNDSMEYNHCVNIAKQEVALRISSLLRDELGEQIPTKEETISEIKFGYYKRMEAYLKVIKPHVQDEQLLCVFSLSQKMDDLSQWRGYCPESGGFCVEFDIEELLTLLDPEIVDEDIVDLSRRHHPCYFFKCCYEPDRNNELVKSLLDDIVHKIESNSENPLLGSVETLMKLYKLATYIKDDSFKNEQEYRLVKQGVGNIRHREGKSMLIPYIELDVSDKDGKPPISRIIVGPTPHPELSMSSVRSLVKSFGYAIEVESSRIPYRPW